jgi:hypothetical protein
MKKRPSPDQRVQHLHDAGLRDGPVQRAVFQALVARGGRIDTGQACAMVYPDYRGRKLNWSRLRNIRRALEPSRSAAAPARPGSRSFGNCDKRSRAWWARCLSTP